MSTRGAMPLHYFIYYRIRPGTAAQAASIVAAMQAQLATDTGVVGRFLHQADDDATCMEIYHVAADAASFERTLAVRIVEMGVTDLLAPGQMRHVERFTECA
jgi:hypothetical protein